MEKLIINEQATKQNGSKYKCGMEEFGDKINEIIDVLNNITDDLGRLTDFKKINGVIYKKLEEKSIESHIYYCDVCKKVYDDRKFSCKCFSNRIRINVDYILKDYISKKELLEWIEENKKTIENTLDNKTYSTQPFVWVSEIINKFNLTN